MKPGRRDFIWLFAVVALVAVAVAYTPYEVPVPRQLVESSSTYSPTPSADTFSFYCTGSRHAKAYTGFQSSSGFPQYSAESGLLDHP